MSGTATTRIIHYLDGVETQNIRQAFGFEGRLERDLFPLGD